MSNRSRGYTFPHAYELLDTGQQTKLLLTFLLLLCSNFSVLLPCSPPRLVSASRRKTALVTCVLAFCF